MLQLGNILGFREKTHEDIEGQNSSELIDGNIDLEEYENKQFNLEIRNKRK